jgi:hypothetical protein
VGALHPLVWGIGLVIAALGFHVAATKADTPAVVLAFPSRPLPTARCWAPTSSPAAGRGPTRDVISAVAITVSIMLVVVFASRLATSGGLEWLAPVGRLAWLWYVPLGTLLAVGTGIASSLMFGKTVTGEIPS